MVCSYSNTHNTVCVIQVEDGSALIAFDGSKEPTVGPAKSPHMSRVTSCKTELPHH